MNAVSRNDPAAVLFRLRYELRQAVNAGQGRSQIASLLERMRELTRDGSKDLQFEYRRWCVHLGC